MEKYKSSVKSSLISRERSVLGGPHSLAIVLRNDMPESDGFADGSRGAPFSVATQRSAALFVWSSGERSDAILTILLCSISGA